LDYDNAAVYRKQYEQSKYDCIYDVNKETLVVIHPQSRREAFRGMRQQPSGVWLCRLSESLLPDGFRRCYANNAQDRIGEREIPEKYREEDSKLI